MLPGVGHVAMWDDPQLVAPGLVGPQGPVGPTFATVFANSQDALPPATPDIGVPGSGQRHPDSVASPATYTPIALSGVVAAGEHTLSISLDCPMGHQSADGSSGDGDLGAVLVGS